jgi:hypothetical protein
LCEFADTVIFVRAAKVENLIVDHFSGSFEHVEDRSGDIANVDDGPPGRAVTLDLDSLGGMRITNARFHARERRQLHR